MEFQRTELYVTEFQEGTEGIFQENGTDKTVK